MASRPVMDMIPDPDAGACRDCMCLSRRRRTHSHWHVFQAHIQAMSLYLTMELHPKQHLMSKAHMNRRLVASTLLPPHAPLSSHVCLLKHSPFKTHCRAAPVQQRVHAPHAGRLHEAAQRICRMKQCVLISMH